jgi:glycerol-3-phosphate dehydrogenase (NAD(P)+)
MNMMAEGDYAVRSIHAITQQHNIHLPIIEAVYNIVYEKANPQAEMNKLKGFLK